MIIVGLGAGGYFGWKHIRSAQSSNPIPPQAAAVPVTVAKVTADDFPVYLSGLGVVEPYDTVTVTSRVDGEVKQVRFKQGQMVKKDDVLIEIDSRPYQAALDQAVAKKAQDEATLKNAQLNLQRYSTLAEKDFASRQQLDTQQATVDQVTAEIKGDQAAIDNAQTQVSYCTIRAPLDGRTGFRLVDPGNIVHASSTTGIVTIVKLQPISVVFTAPEDDVPIINKALAAGDVPVAALSSDGRATLGEGHLALVNNQVDQASGSIRMKATFANEDNALWPGLSVSTRLLADTRKHVVIVPADAVLRGQDGPYAYVVDDANKAKLVQLKLAEEGESETVISEGLQPGQTVITGGQYRVQDGIAVAPTQAPAKAPTQAAAAAPVPETH